MTTLEQVRKALPVVFETSGLPKAKVKAKRAVEQLSPGDVLDVRVGEVSEYGTRVSANRLSYDIYIDGQYVASLFGDFNHDWPYPMDDLAERIDNLVFTVAEMIPQAERSKRAKSPKLTVKVSYVENPESMPSSSV